MPDVKDYLTAEDEQGAIHISEDVVATIATQAAAEVGGVASLCSNIGIDIAELLGKKNMARGVKLTVEDNVITIDVFAMVRYGYTVTSVARDVQVAVSGAVESMTGFKVSAVNVHVAGVVFDREQKKGGQAEKSAED